MSDLQKELLSLITSKLGLTILSTSQPPQGMGSSVFFIRLESSEELVVKIADEENNDANVLKIIQEAKLNIPTPKVFVDFKYKGEHMVVMSKIEGDLLESIADIEKPRYLASMINAQNLIHKIKGERPGRINIKKNFESWKDFLLWNFADNDGFINWKEVLKREMLDRELIQNVLMKLSSDLQNLDFDESEYSLLHTDFNQRNLLVNSDNDGLAGIIDWGEAMFGDPIYDFARVRMFMWHFNFPQSDIDKYYSMVNFTESEKAREKLYWICIATEYLAYYSEEENEFNNGRIKLHQEFLRKIL